MGIIYTVDTVQKGHIPETESFDEVAEYLRKGFKKCPAVLAATLQGGYVHGEYDHRSSIGCVVLFDTNKRERVVGEWKRHGEFAKERHIMIDFTPLPVDPMLTPMYPVGPIFRYTTSTSIEAGGGIKGNLADHLQVKVEPAAQIQKCLDGHAYMLEVGSARYVQYDDEQKARYLTEIVETALRIAYAVVISSGNAKGNAKCDISRRYSDMVNSGLRDSFVRLQRLDEKYSKALTRQVTEGPDCNEYLSMLKEIEQHISLAIEFAHKNVDFVRGGPRL